MIYLYKFTFYDRPGSAGAQLDEWTVTSYERPILNDAYPLLTFIPQAGISHSSLKYDSEKGAGQLTITVPKEFPVANMFLAGYPFGSIYLSVIELDSPAPFAIPQVIWLGRIRTCSFAEQTAELTGTDGREQIARLGLRLNGGTGCQWALGSSDCGVDLAGHTQAGVISAISSDGLTVTVTCHVPAGMDAAAYFQAGRFAANGQVRMVTKCAAGGVLSLMTAINGIAVGGACTASRGCNKTPEVCKGFGNYLNYSAFDNYETPAKIFTTGAK